MSQRVQAHRSGIEVFGCEHALVVQDLLEFEPRIRVGTLLQRAV
jgi:hypothetical protein